MADITEQIASLSPKRLALLAVELQRRVDSLERRGHEPIAIVGIGCRFPGGEAGPDEYWRLLSEGGDAIREVPPERWDAGALYDPDPDAPGKATVRHGAFLEEVEVFDARFFGIAPREAAAIDPQQRLLLEVAWEALEHAAIAPSSLSGSTTGVFVGISGSDFQEVAVGDDASLDAYTASGAAHSVASGRLSYTFGLNGPSISIDTACSSSLVAVHLAVTSLRSGECSLALAGGVNVMLSPTTTIALSKARMLAPDGRCKTFDARADGFARGEGCGVVVLKRLDQAIADGDRIVAVIRGSAVNQDGRSAGLSAPNGPAQEAVIRTALSDAGLEPHEVGYVEAHGTGTALGDPIEMRALGSVLCAGREPPLLVGSVKTNFGHLEAAAGVAGLVKAALALERGEIPPHLHLTERSPHVPWEEFPALEVPTERRTWPEAVPRVAGISSFGFSGTNAHILLEAAPREQPRDEPAARARLLPLSAEDPEALRQLAGLYSDRVRGAEPSDVARICRTAAAGRSHHAQRLALVVSSPDEAAGALESFAAGERSSGVLEGVAGSARRPGIAFLFAGQGSQYAGMGRELYETEPSFRDSIDRCGELLAGRLDRPLLDVLWDADGELLGETAYAQPALVALEIALADLWASWGIRPAAVAGHSVGELAAACVVGALRLEDALALAAERGRLMQIAPRGAMAAVFASEDRVAEMLASLSGRVAIAAVNGAESVTVSGDEQDLHHALARLSAAGIGSKPLAVTRAFHSPLLDPVLGDLQAAATGLQLGEPAALLVSTLTGRPAGRDELADPAYWRRQAREPVRFAHAVDTLVASGSTTFVEIGPGAALVGMARRHADTGDDRFSWLPSLRPGDSGRALLESLGALYVRGYEVDWPAVADGRGAPPAALPTYPFQRRPFPIPRARRRSGTPAASPLLGRRLEVAVDDTIFEAEVGPGTHPFLEDHRVHGLLVLPSPAYVEMGLAAGDAVLEGKAGSIEDLVVHEALVLRDVGQRDVQTVVEPDSGGVAQFRVLSRETDGGWRLHASGRVVADGSASLAVDPPSEIRRRLPRELAPDALYAALARLGLDFGPSFRAVERIAHGDGEVLAEMRLPAALATESARYRVHPALLDSCLHVLGAELGGAAGDLSDPYLLVGLDRLRVHRRPPARFLCHARLHRAATSSPSAAAEALSADIRLLDDDGQVLVELLGVRLKRAPAERLRGDDRAGNLLHQLVWRERPRRALRPAAELAAALTPWLNDLAETHGLEVYDRLAPGLDELCGLYAARALDGLGAVLAPGERIERAGLELKLADGQHRRRLLARLLDWLAEDGVLELAGEGSWNVVRAPSPTDPELLLARLREAFPTCAAELDILGRTGPAAAATLVGSADPLELLFPGGSLDAAERLYGEAPSARAYGALAARAVAEALPAAGERPLRVLEVGAGTGGTTGHVLAELGSREVEYVFTDVSPLFVARAAERFRDRPGMSFAPLDISADPGPQGFETESFDVTVCANVLHATTDLPAALRTLRSLLRPGGLLVLLEATTAERFSDLTVGLTEGWWGFADDIREDYALLPAERWLALLADEGFGSPVSVGGRADAGPLARQALIIARKVATPEAWLVLGDGGGLGERLAARARATGHRCEVLPATAADREIAALATELAGTGQDVVALHLGALDVVAGVDAVAEPAGREALRSALALGQAALSTAAATRLVLATRGAQPVDSPAASPLQAQLWGLARAGALEHPELVWTRLDLDPATDPETDADVLLAELLDDDADEDEVAYRGGRRLVPRLERYAGHEGALIGAPDLCPEGSYLLTGGLRGLGPAVAEWLAARGARHVVLVGRRSPGPEGLAAISRLESAGVRVVTLQADVSSEAGAERAVAAARELGPVRGVIHAAGVLDDGALLQLTPDRLDAVAAPKVRGTLHLLGALSGADLDFLCLFSSGAALLGSPGQANHAAANAFLDALASWLRARGTPAVSIGWGPWAEIGAAAERGAAKGPAVGRIAPADGLAALGVALSRLAEGPAYVAVLPVDWEALSGPARLPLLAELAPPRHGSRAPATGAARKPRGDLAAELAATVPGRRLRVLEDRVRAEAAAVLGLEPGQIDDLDKPLSELGLDSLMAVELRNRIVAAAGCQLPATLLFEHPTVRALADLLTAELLPESTADETAPRSEEEIAALLARKLDSIAAGGVGG
jgi:acyl transferase domain-containing protein/acyl carrier protein